MINFENLEKKRAKFKFFDGIFQKLNFQGKNIEEILASKGESVRRGTTDGTIEFRVDSDDNKK